MVSQFFIKISLFINLLKVAGVRLFQNVFAAKMVFAVDRNDFLHVCIFNRVDNFRNHVAVFAGHADSHNIRSAGEGNLKPLTNPVDRVDNAFHFRIRVDVQFANNRFQNEGAANQNRLRPALIQIRVFGIKRRHNVRSLCLNVKPRVCIICNWNHNPAGGNGYR